MKLKQIAQSGTLESNDIQIILKPHDKTEIRLESPVLMQFGEQIKEVIKETLKQFQVEDVLVLATDNGALDYAIKARVESAIKRGI